MNEPTSMELDDVTGNLDVSVNACSESYLKNLLYPCVPHDVRLPMGFTAQEQSNKMKLLDNNLKVEYIGEGTEDQHAATVRTVDPIPFSCGIYYYEVTVENKGIEGFIGVGLCSSSVSLNKLPGWEKNSYGYHGDDGCIFKGSGAGQNYGPTFGNKDTVGCCYNMAEGTVFYTKNGVHQGIAFSNITSQPMYPAIGLRSPGEVVVVNLGTSAPFMFDIDSYVRDCKTAALNTIRQTPVASWATVLQGPSGGSTLNANATSSNPKPNETATAVTAAARAGEGVSTANLDDLGSMANLTASTASMAGANDGTAAASVAAGKGAEKGTNTLLNQLVLAYMSHNGFSKTAETFAKQTGSALRESIESIVARQRIMASVRNGDIEQAIDATRETYEERYHIFATNPCLLFRLKVRTFVEIIAKRAACPHDAEMLNSLLRFGKDLQKEADTTEELGDQERKKMSNAFSLLAYRDPENSCLAYILAKEEREKLAEELNTCILKCLNIPRVNPIEMLLKQVQVCLDAALERDIASAALVNVKDCLK